jgi:5-methylcytosine-specific restriction endonuclease McrA
MGKLKNIRKKKMIAQGGRCFYCNLPMWDETDGSLLRQRGAKTALPRALRCTAEHLHPRSAGGGISDENIVAACFFCNTQRHRRKQAPSPEAHRQRVRQRMEAGKWLSGQVSLMRSLK